MKLETFLKRFDEPDIIFHTIICGVVPGKNGKMYYLSRSRRNKGIEVVAKRIIFTKKKDGKKKRKGCDKK